MEVEDADALLVAALVLATASAGAFVGFRDVQLALTPDLHDAEMTAGGGGGQPA
jgi:hypothetical protein